MSICDIYIILLLKVNLRAKVALALSREEGDHADHHRRRPRRPHPYASARASVRYDTVHQGRAERTAVPRSFLARVLPSYLALSPSKIAR